MSAKSKIEWCEATWNPLLGCSKIGPDCANCYAIREVHRMAHNPNPLIKVANQGLTVVNGSGVNWSGIVRVIPERLDQPLRRKKPTRYFVNSLSDIFHEAVSDEQLDQMFGVMAQSRQHVFIILTKRAERMAQYLQPGKLFQCGVGVYRWPMNHVWLGISAGDQATLDRRFGHLMAVPATLASVRLLSLEPLIGPIELPVAAETGIDWLIVGGESGPNARPSSLEWVRNLRDWSVRHKVAFFFKQWGNWFPDDAVPGMHHVNNKRIAGRILDGRTWSQFPEDLS